MIGFGIAVMIRGSFFQTKHTNIQTNTGRALEILKNRYARGEITREEYQEMRKDLL
jgi:putative membrane protein